jgi:hypothetical protein
MGIKPVMHLNLPQERQEVLAYLLLAQTRFTSTLYGRLLPLRPPPLTLVPPLQTSPKAAQVTSLFLVQIPVAHSLLT